MDDTQRPPETEIKQLIIIRKDLGMKRGKEIGAACHAAVNVVVENINSPDVKEWLSGSYKKVALIVPDLDALLECERKAKEAGIIHRLQHDEGRTQFNNQRNWTSLAVGPAHPDVLNPLFKDLKLR